MDADVEHGTAARDGLVREPAARNAAATDVRGLREIDVPEGAGVAQFDEFLLFAAVAGADGEHEGDACLADRFRHRKALFEVCGERLLAEDVLAGFGRGDGHGCVRGRPGADVHVVDLGFIREEFLHGGVPVRDAPLLRGGLCLLRHDVRAGDDLGVVLHFRVRREMGIARDASAADDCDLPLFHDVVPFR